MYIYTCICYVQLYNLICIYKHQSNDLRSSSRKEGLRILISMIKTSLTVTLLRYWLLHLTTSSQYWESSQGKFTNFIIFLWDEVNIFGKLSHITIRQASGPRHFRFLAFLEMRLLKISMSNWTYCTHNAHTHYNTKC